MWRKKNEKEFSKVNFKALNSIILPMLIYKHNVILRTTGTDEPKAGHWTNRVTKFSLC